MRILIIFYTIFPHCNQNIIAKSLVPKPEKSTFGTSEKNRVF